MSSSIPYTVPIEGGIPDTHRPHTERTTTILLPKDSSAFLNPVQEYNRDLSVSVIRAWNEERKERLENAWRERRNKKGRKPEATTAEEDATNADGAGPSEPTFRPPKITILEALSATGLRSIRYAKEIPDVKVVLANDLSASACDAMRRNVQLNGVGEGEAEGEQPDVGRREGCNGVVRVNEGDACTLMYNHRDPKARVDMVDLDPYGTAAPFIDAAIGAINDGGLLAVTCTDLAVLAGSNYPEKCFSNYGGVCCNAEYSHEVALRLVLNSLAQAAARYGRTITPLLSFSIDFYVRLFVRVDTKASDVKKLLANTGPVYICTYCETPIVQPLGKVIEKTTAKGHTNIIYKSIKAPTAPQGCAECGMPHHIAGPMWLGPIHDPAFARRVLDSIEGEQDKYGTWPRMNGMLTLAEQVSWLLVCANSRRSCRTHSTSPRTRSLASRARPRHLSRVWSRRCSTAATRCRARTRPRARSRRTPPARSSTTLCASTSRPPPCAWTRSPRPRLSGRSSPSP
jgi:tRNA (guanine26-N2/guanine27-N2)-dimethyltransferase